MHSCSASAIGLTDMGLTRLCFTAMFVMGCSGDDNSSTHSESTDWMDISGGIVVADVGFETPESVLHDEVNDVYLVSNIKKTSETKDNNGFISRVSPDGDVLQLEWIVGGKDDVTLHAPKGMAIASNHLYVADLDTVRVFELETGAHVESIFVEDATFLNDVCSAADDVIFVSDSGKGAQGGIWRLAHGAVEKFASGDALASPNGLLCSGDGVWMVNGEGELIFINSDGNPDSQTTLPKGGLDGIVKSDDGELLISSWRAETVFKGSPTSGFAPVLEYVPSPADIGYDAKRNRLVIPVFDENAVLIFPLP